MVKKVLLALGALGLVAALAGPARSGVAVGVEVRGTLRHFNGHRDPGDGSKVLVFVEYDLVGEDGSVYVLDLGKDAALLRQAEALRGRNVIVKGDLKRRRLTVTALQAAQAAR
jgi:hypothetical protein